MMMTTKLLLKMRKTLKDVLFETDWTMIRLLATRGTTDAEFVRSIAADAGIEMAEVIRRCHELLTLIGDE